MEPVINHKAEWLNNPDKGIQSSLTGLDWIRSRVCAFLDLTPGKSVAPSEQIGCPISHGVFQPGDMGHPAGGRAGLVTRPVHPFLDLPAHGGTHRTRHKVFYRTLVVVCAALWATILPVVAQLPAADPDKTTIQAAPTPPPAPPSAVVRAAPRFAVVIDAAHGGTDGGARLADHQLEKDLVLALSVRLRSMLTAHGIYVVTTREADNAIPALNRAEAANHVSAAACITLHATTSGGGVHLFTASLTQIPLTRFLPWENAQGAYAEQSLRLSSEVSSAMTHAEIPVTLGRTALQPLDSFTCPAVVVEFSPLNSFSGVTPLSNAAYQDRIVAAMAAAVEQWQHDWRQQP